MALFSRCVQRSVWFLTIRYSWQATNWAKSESEAETRPREISPGWPLHLLFQAANPEIAPGICHFSWQSRVGPPCPWNYTYDATGNMIKKVNIADGTTWTYSYNAMNQQTGAIETDSSGNTLADESCVFDVFGNRIEETTETYSGTTVTTTQTKFVYTMDGTLYADLEGSGTVVSRYVSDVDGANHWLARVGTPLAAVPGCCPIAKAR